MTSPTAGPPDPDDPADGTADADRRLAAELRRRRRRLVTALGLPSLACYVVYLALVAFGHDVLRIPVPGGLTVGWLVAAALLVLPWIVCALFARGAQRSLDALRAGGPVPAAAVVHR